MSLESITGIAAISGTDKAEGVSVMAQQASPVEKNQFMSLLTSLDNNVKASDKAIEAYILNDNISTHELMIALEQTKHKLQVAVEVRNKLVSAYQEVIRMRI